jgi:hypothetical protein
MSLTIDSSTEMQNLEREQRPNGPRPEFDNLNAVSSPPTEIEHFSLPPTDHGKEAYLVLLGCTLIQAPIWGKDLVIEPLPHKLIKS